MVIIWVIAFMLTTVFLWWASGWKAVIWLLTLFLLGAGLAVIRNVAGELPTLIVALCVVLLAWTIHKVRKK